MQKPLAATCALAALFAAASLFTGSPAGQATAQGQGQGQGSAPVHIVGPLPVPVTGTSTVSGTVAASQSGAWNVAAAQSGTWNVAASQTGTWNVGVSNTSSNPVPVVFQPGEPVNRTDALLLGGNVANGITGPMYQVPAGKKLTIEDASYTCTTDDASPQTVIFYIEHNTFQTVGGLQAARRYLNSSAAISGVGNRDIAGAELLNIEALNGPVRFAAFRRGTGNISCTLTINGHLNNL